MSALLELQRTLQAQLLRDEQLPADAQRRERLTIYQHNSRTTLVNALRLSFPAVQALVGEDFFEAAARQFIGQHPPRSACLDDYGADFPPFLADFPPARSLSYLADVARLEWAVNRALHANDVPALDVARLSALDPAMSARVCFQAHPAVSVLLLQTPADAIWRAVLEQDAAMMAAIDPHAAPAYLLIEREAGSVRVHRSSLAAWRFASALLAGQPLHAVLANLDDESPHAIQGWLAEHLSAGRFIDFVLNPESSDTASIA